MKLKIYRTELELIDEELMTLIKKRLALSIKIGNYKIEKDLPVFDSKREKELLSKYIEKYDDNKTWKYFEEIFVTILRTSKAIQNE